MLETELFEKQLSVRSVFMNPGSRSFGWLPDVPNIKDYIPETPEVAD
jgi:hypothetical protein